MTINDNIRLYIEAENFAEGEIHDITKWFCYLRDTEDNLKFTKKRHKVELMMRAFIVRKKLGLTVTTKGIEKEFGCSI